ncbi:hypothetical protein UFOVP1357_8 [uncultured Caudovirales phage]|uniref:Uncharacterized protein n=1 Tax=uncultured Caudovirales phage TaxID=2100421 RepID=A0A6J5LI18_9CAUD|nr:hypothetical protein UFOVP18_6 [uncultured Caudovirales phage]CAB4126612.1 hypothetical protein UFOVP82_8 [uncultured Caudovirales phage]CAB4132717.1 hypothetical protein UFOVP258_57 [uncultured Caudovirales phage]CAB4146625.1 hypothetical protein UFOVP502_49 [uncultured Caudovirales phage]CAB4199691.1 hypothetical protein UFOVP1357_8 [uncultured Caudovirales phage]
MVEYITEEVAKEYLSTFNDADIQDQRCKMNVEFSNFCQTFCEKNHHLFPEKNGMDIWLDLVSFFGFLMNGLKYNPDHQCTRLINYDELEK